MSDGSRLRQSWYSALNEAEAHFRQLITLPAAEWKRISNSVDGSSSKQKGKTKVSSLPDLSDVVLHRTLTKGGEDVYRMVLDVPTGEEQLSLEPWKAVLTTPELRSEWDPAVEDAHLVEVFDHVSRVCKTNYTLGWPANPRDSVTISRAFHDTTTLIDITTSLPRSADEPAFLRPSPPFVRSHVHLFAWCIQHTLPQGSSPTETKKPTKGGRLRITCFWQHDLKAVWGFGLSTSALGQQLSTMTLSLFKTVMKRGGRVAKLAGYGNGISVERMRYQIDREALVLDYAVIPDDDDHHETGLQGMDEVHALREHRRLTRSIECVLPTLEGWDVQVTLKGSSEEVEKVPWSAHAMRNQSNYSTFSPPGQIILRVTHGALTDNDAVLKVKVVVEVSGATRGLRLNGLATKIHDLEDRDPSSHFIPQKILLDVASAVDLSFQTSSSLMTTSTSTSSSTGQPLIRPHTERSPAAEKSIQSKVRRNYIYFSSLLQEPEAKWRRTTEARGVSITQLDSIDPTLVVYRAEATFVGVNLWDLYATVMSPGARVFWDKQHEDDTLLEDVNEMSELWYFKTKPAWPVTGRDAVLLKTVYKSPTTIHVFYFSADDPHLFPSIPPADPNVIRTQVDLQGWAIESLSPTTTLLTLLEQSDPKGWTGKTSIPTQMINTIAGIGEFSIKCGGPPIITRFSGAKANELRYDHEKGSFKVEYEPSRNRRHNNNNSNGTSEDQSDGSLPTIELELRCDIDTWGASLDIVVDPPPQTISCLRRHRLSTEGGGLWLTLTHDSILMDDERLLTIVRRAPGKEKGLVMVNGAKVSVDVEEIPEHEIKSLTRQKRVKPPRIPLDQPPVIGVIRRRKAEWNSGDSSKGPSLGLITPESNGTSSSWASAPKIPSPLARIWTYAVDQATTTTQQAVAAIAPATYSVGTPTLDPTKLPMQYALEALAWAQEFNSKPQTDGWVVIYEKGITLQKKLIPEISPYIPVHKGVKVIEGVSAGELMSVILENDCRKTWDERYDSAKLLESYGGQAQTSFFVAKASFPFRDRGFYLASVVACPFTGLASSPSRRRSTTDDSEKLPSARNTIFCVSASFSPESAKTFSSEKYNPYSLPIGRMYVDAWILETLDPYTTENYAIPSTRCTRLVAVDYAGSIPAAVNSMINAALARSVLAVEAYMKNNVQAALPVTRLPAPGVMISDKRPEEHSGTALSTSGTGSLSVDGGLVVAAPFMAWKLRKKDECRLLVETKFNVEKVVYRNSVFLRLPSRSSSRREASNATITNNLEVDSSFVSMRSTPRPSRLMLSTSPQGNRQPLASSDVPLSSGPSSSVIAQPWSGSSAIPNTPMMRMPGSMTVSGLPSTSPYNAGGSISGLPSVGSPTASAFPPLQSNSQSSSTVVASSGTNDNNQDSRTSNPSSPPSRTRQRAASSGSGALYPELQAYNPAEGLRGRTTTLTFAPKGDVRHNTDLVVMEVVIDSKLFRAALNGGKGGRYLYMVDVLARPRKSEVIALRNVEVVGKTNGTTSIMSSAPRSLSSASSNGSSSPPEFLELPFGYTVHTMPSSPSHSSELSSEAPSRHLLRVTLPTAQYLVNSFWDPLAGEMREPPPKPEWMKILEGHDEPDQEASEGKQGGKGQVGHCGIIVDVVVRRCEAGKETNEKEGKVGSVSLKKAGKDNAKGRQIVLINGKEVGVVGEKESLTSLGRDELLDDRVAKMGVLSRIPNESEPLPDELKAPIGISEELLLPVSSSADTPSSAEEKNTDDESVNGNGSETPSTPNMEVGHIGGGTIPGNGHIGEPHAQHAAASAGESGLAGGGGGFLGFLQAYPNPLLMKFGFSARISGDSSPERGDSSGSEKEKDKALLTEGPNSRTTESASSADVIGVTNSDGGMTTSSDSTQGLTTTGRYGFSTLVFVGLIAFLIGSLLRSLLSPADFIYVVGDRNDVREAQFGGEWREIRRLLEIKYLFGGWDFQIAVVQRHN